MGISKIRIGACIHIFMASRFSYAAKLIMYNIDNIITASFYLYLIPNARKQYFLSKCLDYPSLVTRPAKIFNICGGSVTKNNPKGKFKRTYTRSV